MRLLDIGSGRPTFTDERGLAFETLDREPSIGCDHCVDMETVSFGSDDGFCGQFDEIRAHHFLEHIRPWKKVWVMTALYRWLKPGGTLDIEVPLAGSKESYMDPTHLSFWVPESFWYFEKGNRFGEAFARRTPGSPLFETVAPPHVVDGWKLRATLRRPEYE